MSSVPEPKMVEIVLARIVLRDSEHGQHLYLLERGGKRGFPMVIGRVEAEEIQRIVSGTPAKRPMTHQLAASMVEALGGHIVRADIVDMQEMTFLAQLVLATADGHTTAVLDARPSDAIALALRAGAPLRVAEFVLEEVRTDRAGPDPLPESEPPETT